MSYTRLLVPWLLVVCVSCQREEPDVDPAAAPTTVSTAEPAPATTAPAQTVALLPLGDSITIGAPHTYRCELHKALAGASPPYDFVGSLHHNPARCPGTWDMDHEGHSGWTTAQIDDKLDGWLAGYTPDVALIHLGTNDAFRANRGASVDASEASMRSIVAKLRADNPEVKIFLAQILPLGDMGRDNRRANAFITDWNDRLVDVAASMGTGESPVTLVDMHGGFGAVDLEDGIHPTADAAARMAAIWAEAVGAP